MKLSLVVMTAGKSQGQAIPVTLSQFIIGRDPQCNLRPGSAIISKRHCAVLIKEGKVFVRDFESTNGTFINGTQVKGEVAVSDGDILKIGPLEFKIAIEPKPATAKPTPPPAAKPAAAPKTADDSVAAMLLSLGDGEKAEDGSTSNEEEVPAGSTVMDVVSLPPDTKEEQVAAPAAPKEKPPEKKPDPKKGDPAHLAAKAILEKYTRRQRG